MPVVTISPVAVSVTTRNTDTPSSLIGGDTALSDSTDSTYAEVWASTRVGRVFALVDNVHATMPSVPGVLTINSATLSVRLRYLHANGAVDRQFHVYAETAAPSLDYIASFEHAGNGVNGLSTVPAIDTTYTITDWSIYDNNTPATLDSIYAQMATRAKVGTLGFNLNAIYDDAFPAPADWGIRVYELSLTLDYNTPGAPPLRRYPPVNNGGSGPTRHWPRTVNRRAGGTY